MLAFYLLKKLWEGPFLVVCFLSYVEWYYIRRPTYFLLIYPHSCAGGLVVECLIRYEARV